MTYTKKMQISEVLMYDEAGKLVQAFNTVEQAATEIGYSMSGTRTLIRLGRTFKGGHTLVKGEVKTVDVLCERPETPKRSPTTKPKFKAVKQRKPKTFGTKPSRLLKIGGKVTVQRFIWDKRVITPFKAKVAKMNENSAIIDISKSRVSQKFKNNTNGKICVSLKNLEKC